MTKNNENKNKKECSQNSPVNLRFVIKLIATEFFSLPYILGWSTKQHTKNPPKSVKGKVLKFGI